MNENGKNGVWSISTGTIVKFFLIGLLFLALYYLFDVVLVLVAAIVIASSMEPVVRRMKRRGVHRIVSVVILYVILLFVIAGLIIFFMPMVVTDAVEFFDGLPDTISFSQLWSPVSSISGVSGSPAFDQQTVYIADFIRGLRTLLVGDSAGAFQTASMLFGGMLSLILMLVLSFYLSVKEEGVDDFLRIVTPVRHHEYIIGLWKRSQRKIALWLQGQVILGIVVGVLVYIMLISVGIPHALMLAVFAGLFEIIPIFGPIISSIPAILIAFLDEGMGTGFLLVGLYIIIYQLESQIFYPLVVRKVVGISPVVVILALVIGAKLAGILGAIVSVPLSAAIMEYISDIEKYKELEKAERAQKMAESGK